MVVTEDKIAAYAHCKNPICPGYGQEKVDAVRTTTAFTFKDNGGNLPGIERSTADLRFFTEDGDDDAYRQASACRSCGNPRELSEQPRPSYQPLSGFDPMGLINGSVGVFDPNKVNTEADARIAALEATVAQQAAMVEKLLEATAEGSEGS